MSINLGNGRFQPQQAESGLDLPQGRGLGLVIADFNDDGRLDIFVANDMSANYLLINDQSSPNQPLHFRNEAILRSVALDEYGLSQACMGIACADINRDAVPDLFVTNFAKESDTLYLSQAGGFFQDCTQSSHLRRATLDPLGFGTQFLDADNDGWDDLVLVNGHIDQFPNQPFQMKAQLFRGEADGHFSELFASSAGVLFDKPRLGRGLATLDWNRDGFLDFVATDLEESVVLGENRSDNRNHSLRIKLIGTQSNRDAIGARVRVTVTAGDTRFLQMKAGDGYESSNEHLLCIGVEQVDHVQHVEIKWPSGQMTSADQIGTDQEWVVIEGAANWLTQP